MHWDRLRDDMGHGSLSDTLGEQHFLNLTCDMGTPNQGPLLIREWPLFELSFRYICVT